MISYFYFTDKDDNEQSFRVYNNDQNTAMKECENAAIVDGSVGKFRDNFQEEYFL